MKSSAVLIIGTLAIVLSAGIIVYVSQNKDITAPTSVVGDTEREERIQKIEEMQRQGVGATQDASKDSAEAISEIAVDWQPPVAAGQKVTLTGYFEQYSYYDELQGEDVTCNALRVLDGDMEVAEKLNKGMDLTVNLDWELFSEADKTAIRASSESDPITLSFVGNKPGGGEIPACMSYWLILDEVMN